MQGCVLTSVSVWLQWIDTYLGLLPSLVNFMAKLEPDRTQNGEDLKQFYTNLHPFYCGIDLHARIFYGCILDERGDILVHKKINDTTGQILKLPSSMYAPI